MKLNYTNNWHNDEYSVGGSNYTPMKRVIELKKVRIGRKEYKVTTRSVSIDYIDMGHQYTATSDHYFVTEEVFGIKREFDLNEIIRHKPIFALDYKTEP